MKKQNNISDAEWQVMRMIWAGEETKSAEIIDVLGKSKGWSPTTIKTLLARLVKKNVISFNLDDRTRLYYPLLTEMECVRREMNNVIMRLYGGIENHSTEHFSFYGCNDKGYINQLAGTLEHDYGMILNILGISHNEKTMVCIHESKMHLHSALGVQNGPEWLRAGWAWGILHIAPKDCFDDIKPERAAVHIFVQMCINKLNPGTPYWLMQGYSAYLGKWLNSDRIRHAINERLGGRLPESLEEIGSDFEKFRDNMGYELAYTVAQYIIMEYGAGHMTWFIKSPTDYEGIFHCSKERFQKRWLKFVEKKYIGGKGYAF